MVEHHMEELEAKIQQMLGMIRRLREEKVYLEERLVQQERELLQWQEEKGVVRERIERILEELGTMEPIKS